MPLLFLNGTIGGDPGEALHIPNPPVGIPRLEKPPHAAFLPHDLVVDRLDERVVGLDALEEDLDPPVTLAGFLKLCVLNPINFGVHCGNGS